MTSAHSQQPEPDTFRCSFGQQSLWLIDQLEPGSPAYNLHAALRTPFALSPAPLSAACAALADRHETLRTWFDWDGAEPVQRLTDDPTSFLRMADLKGMSPSDADAELARLSREDAATPFDLTQAPLLRVGLVQMPGGASVLLLTIHHIIADAWSMNILIRDLLELYVAGVSGREPQLPDLPVQYIDFAAWQRDLIGEDRNDELVEGWRAYLAGAGELDLPSDHPRRPERAHHGDHIRFRLSPQTSKACLDRAREFAVTPYALITGCFSEVLRRYGGGEDFMIGMPTAGRPRSDLEDLIGFFVRTLVLRVDLTGEPGLRGLAKRVSASVARALTLQDLPFERVVEMADPERDLSVNPLFRVTCQYLGNPLERAKAGSIDVVDLHRGYANFDLTLDFWEENGVLTGRLEYDRDLYEPQTITRLIGHLTTLLEGALQQPDLPLRAIGMLTPDEQNQIAKWSEGSFAFPNDVSLPALFEEIAATHPDLPAVRDAEGDLSYSELDRLSAELAHRLIASGVGQGDFVGHCLPRGRKQIIALLAIVRAGAAYVALEDDWPAERLRTIAGVTGLRVVVSDHAPNIAAMPDIGLMATDGPGAPPVDLKERTDAGSLAYAAFTSGSTGVPKGVPTTHRAVVRLMRGGAPLQFAPGDVMLGFAPLGFDASTFEIWGPLLTGACIAVAAAAHLSPHELAGWMEQAGVTKCWLTAGFFSQMSAARPDMLAGLQMVFAGGDVLSETAVGRVLDAGGTVINGYGPTENTVFTCCSVMASPEDIRDGIRIGRPVPGTIIRVLDPDGHAVPVGVPGELVAGGAGVSPGYLGNHPDNDRFSPLPWSAGGEPGYRTGDLVRWTSQGELEFLGRADRQVKIRGFRVEPGAIEREIMSDPAVRDCVVAVQGGAADDKALVAFVLPEAGDPDVVALRQTLSRRLPAQSMPSGITVVSEMPLGSNGKVDVAALLALPPDDVGETTASGALTEVEELVAETIADVLGLPSVPADAVFFDLGGHSLHATRVVTRLRETLDVDLPLQAIFEAPSVRGLAGRLEDILLSELENDPGEAR
ncbi:non-ribosomal peptide synthetase [Roseobacter sp. S98]|uniref:non-ribosomal peptide synthetase n=1 Tax=Roseobacter algicola (ex Choi et al. 2025) (nom. illeg.) TaxID=3092138 RepID=UPI003F50D8A4